MARDNTFIVRIVDTDDNTWRGTITWTNDDRCEDFRSTLELLKLIDSAVMDKSASIEIGSA